MSDSLGSLCIVLHGHLPYVLHHGSYPHGEAWLYEAAAETYLPVLDMIGAVALNGKRPAITVGLTPVLLEQLAHERFKGGFVDYLNERVGRAAADRKEFERANDGHSAYLATRWEQWYTGQLQHFEDIKRDIPAEFAKRYGEGHIQILTSNATHAYMPLLLNDEMCRAQMTCGTLTSERHLGKRPKGMWLPECAYRPHANPWYPAVLYDNPRDRPGIEKFIAEAGVNHFFVDSHMVERGTPLGYIHGPAVNDGKLGGFFHGVSGDPSGWDRGRGWRWPLEPVGVASSPGMPQVAAFARHPRVSEQVWSGSIGYPGAGEYLEFHRKLGERGLRYHKVTSTKTALSDKRPYYPDDVPGKLHEHAIHFCEVVKDVLRQYRDATGRQGVVVAPFDAELFGHWWFEGVDFLRDVILNLANDPAVELRTSEEALERQPPDKVMRLPEGSWGEEGDHRVWLNDRTKWIWEMEYRAEGVFLKHLHGLPWRQKPEVREMLERAGRQLLLLQASDWPFVIHSEGAVDYGTQRFAGHTTRFDRLARIAEELAAGREIGELERAQVNEADTHDPIFKEIDLEWWLPK